MPTPSATTPASTTLLPGSAQLGVILEIDPLAEDAANTPLALVDNSSLYLLEEDLPAPEEDPLWTSSRDMDGEALVHTRHRNRKCTWKIRAHGSSHAALQELVLSIEKKVEKLRREGGTIQRTVPSNHAYFLDVVAGTTQVAFDRRWINTYKLDVTLELTARPYWRGGWATVGTVTETTLPCAIFDTDQIPGSVPALGRLVVENTSPADQAFLMWGLQSKTYDDAASAALFYEAEDLTPLGDAHVTTITGSSGGDLVYCGDILVGDTWAGILSTGTLTHTGDYRVWARIAGSVPSVRTASIALEWATGDFRSFTRNDPVSLPGPELNGVFRLVDLGLVHIPDDEAQWEGRVIVKCDQPPGVADIIGVDYLLTMPVTEGYGEAQGVNQAPTATTFQALDGFDQTAGNLAGKSLPVGGTWAGAGDSTDFTVATVYPSDHLAEREAASDTAPRVEYVGSLSLSGVVVGAKLACGVNGAVGDVTSGVLARYVDTSNYLTARVVWSETVSPELVVSEVVAGTATVLESELSAWGPLADIVGVEVVVTSSGEYTATFTERKFSGARISLSGFSANLASGGALEDGSIGLYDYNSGATASIERSWDDFYAHEIPSDPAVFAGQNLEVLHDRVVREHSTGTALTRVSYYAGDYLLVPCSAGEERAARIIAKTSRGNPSRAAADGAIDDLTATLYVKPRFIHLPE